MDIHLLRHLNQQQDELSEEGQLKYEQLLNERRLEQLRAIPKPTCCEAAQKYPVITFYVSTLKGDSNEAPGRWIIQLDPASLRHLEPDYFEHMPEPKCCPFCGTNLPTMVRIPDKPDICRVTDGGYYCDVCSNRLSSCICLPPEAAFEPEVLPEVKEPQE